MLKLIKKENIHKYGFKNFDGLFTKFSPSELPDTLLVKAYEYIDPHKGYGVGTTLKYYKVSTKDAIMIKCSTFDTGKYYYKIIIPEIHNLTYEPDIGYEIVDAKERQNEVNLYEKMLNQVQKTVNLS